MGEFLAIDIGGTTMKGALVSRTGALEYIGSLPTGSSLSHPELENALSRLCSRAEARTGIDGVGISTLGILDDQGTILGGAENIPCLEGFSFRTFFARRLPGVPAEAVNDASAAALGEKWQGAAREMESFLCVAFGTGIGGGLVLNGKPWRGANGRAGEIGYWDFAGPQQYWEREDSAVSLIYTARLRTGCPDLTGPEFFERAFQKDPVCLELFTRWAQRTGRVFANMALLLDMQGIVVGGGISAQGDALTLPLQRAMDSCLPVSFRGSCRVVPAQLGNHAALLGAASLLADREN